MSTPSRTTTRPRVRVHVRGGYARHPVSGRSTSDLLPRSGRPY